MEAPGQQPSGLQGRGPAQPAFRNAVDERAWRHQQLARSLQTGGAAQGDADFAFALQLALEDEAAALPARGPQPRQSPAAASSRPLPANQPISPATGVQPPVTTPAKKRSYFKSLKESLQGKRQPGTPGPEEPSPLPSPVPSSTPSRRSEPDFDTETSPLPHHVEDQWAPDAVAPAAYASPPRAAGAGVRQAQAMSSPREQNSASVRSSSFRRLSEIEVGGNEEHSPRALSNTDSRNHVVPSARRQLPVYSNEDEDMEKDLQDSQEQADSSTLLQDSRLLRRDITQSTQDHESQKVDLERQRNGLNEAMRRSSRYADSPSAEEAFLRHTEQHARLEEDHRLVLSRISALHQASAGLRNLEGFVQHSKPPAAQVIELQDAVICEYLGRLSVLGVILLDLPPEVAASYAAPNDVAGGPRLSAPGSSRGSASASSNNADSHLRQLLRSPDIDMSAAMAVIQHGSLMPAGGRAGSSQAGPVSGSTFGGSLNWINPASSHRLRALSDRQLSQRSSEGSMARVASVSSEGPSVAGSGSFSGSEAHFSFSRPRDASSQPTSPALNGLTTTMAGRFMPASHDSGRVSPSLTRLRSEDSDAKEAAELLMAHLSASDDEYDEDEPAASLSARTRESDASAERWEADLQRQQQDAEDKRMAASAALVATAAAEKQRVRLLRAEEERATLERNQAEADRAEAEAHARAEEEAQTRARAEEEAKAQARAKEKARARARAEEEAQARAEVEARARAEEEAEAEARAAEEHLETQRALEVAAMAEARERRAQEQRLAGEAEVERQNEAAAAAQRRADSAAAAAAADARDEQLHLARAEIAEAEARQNEMTPRELSARNGDQDIAVRSNAAAYGSHAAQDISPRSSSPTSVPAEVEAELRLAAGMAVASGSARPPPSPLTAAEEGRTAERRKREERQAALAAQKRDIQSRRQRRLSAQPDMSAFSITPAPLKAVLKTPPSGVSPEPSPPRSPVSGKSVTFAPVPIVVSVAPSTISSSSSGSRSSRSSTQTSTGVAPSSRSGKTDRSSNGSHRSPGSSQRQEEENRMQRIEKEFAVMELHALMARHSSVAGSSGGRRSRTSCSRGGSVDGDRSPEGSRSERASSVTGSEGRHSRGHSEDNELMVRGSLHEYGGSERPRKSQNGGIPAAATLAGGRRSSLPDAASLQQRMQYESSGPPASSPRGEYVSRSSLAAPQTPEASKRPAPPSPRVVAEQSVRIEQSPAVQQPSRVQASEGTGAGVKAASAWTAALDAMAMARRKKGTSGPAHLAGAQGSLTPPSGKSSPESAAASRQAAAALAAEAAAERLQVQRVQQSKLAQEHSALIKRLGADVERFKATNMAELAAFVRRAKAQLPSNLNEDTLLQMGWPGAKWRVMSGAISAWQEVAQMTDAQLAWQMLDEFPLSDEAMRVETYFDIVEHSPADLDSVAKDQSFRIHGIPWDPEVYTPLRLASLNLAKLYMESTLSEASKVAPGSSLATVESAISHLMGSVRLTLRVQKFAGGLNRECASLLTSVRQMQNSLQ